MQIVSAYLLAAASGGGYSGNIITDDQLNISNWDITGDITNSYVNGVNNISFENTGGGGGGGSYVAPNGNTYKYKYHYYGGRYSSNGRYISYAYEFDIYSNLKLVASNTSLPIASTDSGEIYFYSSLSDLRNLDKDINSIYPAADRTQFYYDPVQSGSWILQGKARDDKSAYGWKIVTDIPQMFDIGTTKQQVIDYLTTPDVPAFDGDIQLNIPVVAGKTYEFRFDGCSPSGFTSDDNNISIVSGANITTAQFDGTATETMGSYRIPFEAGSDTATLTFDLSQMTSSSGISLNISNLSVFEVVR